MSEAFNFHMFDSFLKEQTNKLSEERLAAVFKLKNEILEAVRQQNLKDHVQPKDIVIFVPIDATRGLSWLDMLEYHLGLNVFSTGYFPDKLFGIQIKYGDYPEIA